jgi:hypothetical protein
MKRVAFPVVITGLAVIFFSLAHLSQPVHAQEDQIQKLQQRIVELEKRIKALEADLKVCIESRMAARASEYGWQNKKNWRRLETGMPQDQVETILGEPVKVIKGYRTLWYYPNIYCGYVSFDEKGNLTGWSEP